MHQEKYNLKWHTYSDHLTDMLRNMMKSDHLTDVTLVCDDKRKFKAHKVVLSACSSVFKHIIDDLPKNDSVIYLKGVHHQDLESILEFMYLGVATFNENRMNDLLDVAKNLDLKEIGGFDHKNVLESAGIEEEFSNEYIDAQETSSESGGVVKQETMLFKSTSKQCPDCEKVFATAQAMTTHHNSIHLGIKYGCNQCDFQGTTQGHLTLHIRSKHEGIKYSCNQCNYQAGQSQHLKLHIDSKHVGIRYNCDQCDHQYYDQSNLRKHKQSKHEGVRFSCEYCEYGAKSKDSLRKHVLKIHNKLK